MSFPDSGSARIAVRALINQLKLAVQLLEGAIQTEEEVSRRDELVAHAREAYRHSLASLTRVPQLSADEMKLVDSLSDRFRALLKDLDQ